MIRVTYEPMEAYLLMCRIRIIPDGHVPHWTGTHDEMISLNLHGAEEPTRWMLRPYQGAEIGQRLIRGFALEKKRTFHQRHFGRA